MFCFLRWIKPQSDEMKKLFRRLLVEMEILAFTAGNGEILLSLNRPRLCVY